MPLQLPWQLMAVLMAATRMRRQTMRCMMLTRQMWGLQQVRAGSLLQAAGPFLV